MWSGPWRNPERTAAITTSKPSQNAFRVVRSPIAEDVHFAADEDPWLPAEPCAAEFSDLLDLLLDGGLRGRVNRRQPPSEPEAQLGQKALLANRAGRLRPKHGSAGVGELSSLDERSGPNP